MLSSQKDTAFVSYIRGNWGDLCDEDKELNNEAVAYGGEQILGAYETTKGRIWILTEWDRSVTTILLPHEK